MFWLVGMLAIGRLTIGFSLPSRVLHANDFIADMLFMDVKIRLGEEKHAIFATVIDY